MITEVVEAVDPALRPPRCRVVTSDGGQCIAKYLDDAVNLVELIVVCPFFHDDHVDSSSLKSRLNVKTSKFFFYRKNGF